MMTQEAPVIEVKGREDRLWMTWSGAGLLLLGPAQQMRVCAVSIGGCGGLEAEMIDILARGAPGEPLR